MSEIIDGDEPLDDAPLAEPAPQPAAEPAPEPPLDPEREALARKYGWRPRAESTLPDASYMDAERFLAAGKTRLRIQEDQIREANARIAAAESIARTAAETVRRQERARYDAEVAAIRAGMREAVKSGDEEAYDELERRERDLRQPSSGPSPDVAAYASTKDGAWVNDPLLRQFGAQAIQNDAAALAMSPLDQVKWAAERVKEYFPHKFAAPQPREPETGRYTTSRVDAGGLAGGRASSTHGLSSEEYAEAVRLVNGPFKGQFKDVGAYIEYAKKLKVLE